MIESSATNATMQGQLQYQCHFVAESDRTKQTSLILMRNVLGKLELLQLKRQVTGDAG